MRRLAIAGAILGLAIAQARADSVFDRAERALDNQAPTAASVTGADNYDAASLKLDAAWSAMPLAVQHAVFVTRKASGYGVYDERPTNEFAQGETLYMYAEPIGYLWKRSGTDAYTFGVKADLSLKDSEGNILSNQPNFANLTLTSHAKNREFMLSLDLTVTGLKPGHYSVEYKLTDINSAKTTTFRLPFKIKDGA